MAKKGKGHVQMILWEILEKEGKIERLGETYQSYSARKHRTSLKPLYSFIEEAKKEGYKLKLGKFGGLFSATLYKE